MPLTIDREFKLLIPPLSNEEYSLLCASIQAEGCRDALIAWQVEDRAILLDGHNRAAICDKYGIDYRVEYITLADRPAAINWIIDHQLGRRNLSPEQRLFLIGKRYNAEKKATPNPSGNNQHTEVVGNSYPQPKERVSSQIASQHNISEKTVRNAGTFAAAVEAIDQIAEGSFLPEVMAGQSPFTQKETVEIAKRIEDADDQERAFILEKARQIKEQEAVDRQRKRDEERERKLAFLQQSIKPAKESGQNYRLIVDRAESLSRLDADSVDYIITSPPYNLGSNQWDMGVSGSSSRPSGIGYADDLPFDEYVCWQIAVFNALYRVAKPGSSFFYNHKCRTLDGKLIHPMIWIGDPRNPWTIRQEIVWDRKSTHNHEPRLFWQEDERIYWMTKGKPNLHPDINIRQSTVWSEFGPVANTWHPAPFTLELPRMLLRSMKAMPGQVVLDPFAGSCTTIEAALEAGCFGIGVDICEEYLRKACIARGWQYEQ